jgi:assimilatory nitrate reductase catalytic subunit
MTATETHCPYCSLQCGMKLTGARSLEVAEWKEFPVNQGAMCRKGWTSTALLRHRERLTTPLVRDRATGEFRPADWDEALDLVADRLAELKAAHGPDSIGVFGGGGLTNEKAYQLGKFARVALGTSQIDYNGRWCMSSAASAGTRAFGLDRGLPFPLADLEQTDVLVLVGSNLAETMPPAARHLVNLRERGGKVVLIDPRRTSTADKADVFVQPVPGTDLALAQSLLHLVVAGGWVDEEYVAARTTGFQPVKDSVASWWPERAERVTGVPAGELRDLARLLGEADKVMILTARGAEQHASGSDTVLAWINLALALGQCGTEYAGYGCLTGQGNGQGGREHGQKADQLPGYRMIDDPAAREHVAGVWGVEPDSLPGKGRSAYELLDALGQEGGPKALLVFGSNIIVSAPNVSHVAERLDALDLLVVADMVMSETAARADVVLPITQWAEETGTMTNLEGRVILRNQAITPPEGVRSDLEILNGLAERLKSPIGFSTDPEEIFAELGRASAGGKADYSGITYERIREEHGVFWPCPSGATSDGSAHPGTPRMFLDAFATPDGRALFHLVEHRGPAEQPDDDYPVHLTTGRVLAQYQSGAQTRRVRELTDDGAFVEMHPMLAGRIGTADGEPVRISTRRGVMVAPARVVSTIRPDTVFVPFHWVGANKLTNDALDPASRMPEFKVCAASVVST